ncbi:PEP-CTERM protein-sorting domain-containing protein [Duganella sp. CF458]|uniref:PEP-CTERM sorting domain-containing protein n=1 Tax=Duganella sp. CF458 TaxID=1884368 RepID=UPI0008E1F73E|nr:PEP-CTERM sorting domain-containing protein [Duganella sp. CF458]SFG67788.1 PEP-CTERM protein-sorting domain-containing protein [Duganella sp. CF458]
MKANTLFKSCLLACSVLAGAQAIAGPGTVNSIEFSFMSYSSTASQSFSNQPLPSFDIIPTPSVTPIPSPQEILPVVEVYLPSTNAQTDAPAVITAPDTPQAALAVPEPGTLALLGLGCVLLCLRRREGSHG